MQSLKLKNNYQLYSMIGKLIGQLNSMFFPYLLNAIRSTDIDLYKKLLKHRDFVNKNIKDAFIHSPDLKQNSMFLFTIYVYLFALRDFLLLTAYKYKIDKLLPYIKSRFQKGDILNGSFLLKWLNNIITNSLIELKQFKLNETRHIFIENYVFIEQDEDSPFIDNPLTSDEDTNAPASNEENKATGATDIGSDEMASPEDEKAVADIMSRKTPIGDVLGGGFADREMGDMPNEGKPEGGAVNPDIQITISYLKRLLSLVSDMKLFAPPLVGDYLDNLLSYLDNVAQFIYDKQESTEEEDIKRIREYKQKLQYLLNLFNQRGIHLPAYQSLQKILST